MREYLRGTRPLTQAPIEARQEVTITSKDGLHARPVMRFVDLASTYGAKVTVTNVSKGDEPVDGKSAMQMMLLEATQGSVLRIEAWGDDATEAVDALAKLIRTCLDAEGYAQSSESSL